MIVAEYSTTCPVLFMTNRNWPFSPLINGSAAPDYTSVQIGRLHGISTCQGYPHCQVGRAATRGIHGTDHVHLGQAASSLALKGKNDCRIDGTGTQSSRDG
jgi:hypothetical protein